MITIHYQGKTNSKYESATFKQPAYETIAMLNNLQLWVLHEDGTRELILPHRVTAIVISDKEGE